MYTFTVDPASSQTLACHDHSAVTVSTCIWTVVREPELSDAANVVAVHHEVFLELGLVSL